MRDYANKFKASLKAGKKNIGLWLSIPDAFVTEICATAEFDWLLLDGEHTPNDIRTMLSQLQACQGYNTHPVARPVIGDTHLIKQLLDIGVQSILVPMVDTAEQARALVRACRYPPHGVRGIGFGTARVSRWDARQGYAQGANDEICLLVQAETREAIQNLDEICGVEGVDGVFLGPSDLAGSYGHLGNPGHPEVQAVIEDGIARIVKSGKAAGILTPDRTLAKRYLDLGATFVAVGLEARVLAQGVRDLRKAFV